MTYSYLAFGFDLKTAHPFTRVDEYGEPEQNWMDFLAQKAGLRKPAELGEDDYDDEAKQAENQEAFEQYYAAQRALLEPLGCQLSSYGFEQAPEFFVELVLPQDKRYAHCRQLELEQMKAVDNEANRELLRRFCSLLEIEFSEPGWCLLRSIGDD
ncbi:MAG: hypothetical protein K2X27_03170 [Candidatus Obscuribacterales bacterium]|nr:hypothetical protein [Candidatus Obscuribacterales bacterium]